MKMLKKAIAPTAIFALLLLFQCTSSKVSTYIFQDQIPFKVNTVSFQEWYAGVKVETSGINMYVPIVDVDSNVVIDQIFFRNLKGKLVKNRNEYVAVLKNSHNNSNHTIADRLNDYPFNLKKDECVISYVEDGQNKYYKLKILNELASTYYENQPKSIYITSGSSGMASLDNDDD